MIIIFINHLYQFNFTIIIFQIILFFLFQFISLYYIVINYCLSILLNSKFQANLNQFNFLIAK